MGAVQEEQRTRRGRLVPWTLLAMWLVVLVLASPLAGKLSGVQQNRNVDYLPASADSTQVAKVQDRLPGGESTDMVVVYHRDGGLTEADRRTAAGQIDEIAAAHKLSAQPRAVPSKDGTTLMYPVSSTEPGQDKEAKNALVDDVRETVRGTEDGLTAEVGGRAGVQADSGKVFESLDGPLLYTTVAVVAVLLVLIYRSPLLWLVPLLTAGAANFTAMAVAYGLHAWFDTTVTGANNGMMTILVFGAGTDYALLLVSRYREELRRVERPYDAMRAALRGCGPAVLASSGTVAAGLLCLLAADLNSTRGMGPFGTVGVLSALLAMMTLLPALLVLLGRRVFWPLVPVFGSEPKQRRSVFAAMGSSAGRRPVTVLLTGAAVLGALALGTLNLQGSLKNENSFIDTPESITAARTLATAYPELSSQPIDVVVPADQAGQALERIRGTEGVAAAEPRRSGTGWTEIAVTADAPPESAGETATIHALRSGPVGKLGGHVGGPSAQLIDLKDANAGDRDVVVPLVLGSVLIVLIVLLRSLVAPLLLVGAVVAVWGAALGIGGLVFEPVLGIEGNDPALPLLSFVFLVALGVDYGIFLMHRMREESLSGLAPEAAALRALRATGGVIASAGLVLAATFSVLAGMPLVMLVELGFVIAVGVLLDTFLVRTYLVTSASVALGRKVWWPGPLSKEPPAREDRPAPPVQEPAALR
ncbi:MMPL family transporter [Streptomyces kebangsaanensis]|uniref:MMPL family transporter n=1 Tax=Streptomyces kebangsaanensis TaxID=864058 RepID=A0ABW6KUU9_9ACTN